MKPCHFILGKKEEANYVFRKMNNLIKKIIYDFTNISRKQFLILLKTNI